MKDFISLDFDSSMAPGDVMALAEHALPDFAWRSGDSDMQGPYVSGMNASDVQIKIWLGEQPFQMSVSFRALHAAADAREKIKEELMERINKVLAPQLGQQRPRAA